MITPLGWLRKQVKETFSNLSSAPSLLLTQSPKLRVQRRRVMTTSAIVSVENLEERCLLSGDPIANDDTFTTNENETALLDVLANDTGPASLYTLDSSQSSNGGQISIVSNQIEYTPMEGFSGTDTFTYNILMTV